MSSSEPSTSVVVARNTLLHPISMLVVGLALAIGWGIRGNYGHETGAMFPGAVAAIAACLLSGRSDWHRRVAYFGLFGMLGWAFGGSISYMMVIGYTQSGHSSTQLFGFIGLFVIGFLWAGFGGAGTALPAALDDKQLKSLFISACRCARRLACNVLCAGSADGKNPAMGRTGWNRKPDAPPGTRVVLARQRLVSDQLGAHGAPCLRVDHKAI